jgi:predicted transcriptional regulator
MTLFEVFPHHPRRHPLNVYIPQELKDRLDRLAEKDRRSLSVTVELLLLDALERRESK